MLEAQPFGSLKEKLLRGGIAPWRVRRYLAELDDHLADLTEAELAAGSPSEEATQRARALLGNDSDLADAWLTQPKLRSLTARAPWLVFGLIPPFALIAGFVIPILLMILLAKITGRVPAHAHGLGILPMWFRMSAHAVSLALNFMVGPLLLAWLAAIAQRQRLNPIWPLFATGFTLLFFLRLVIVIPPPGHPNQIQLTSFLVALLTGKPRIAIGGAPTWQIVAQALLTLLPMLWLIYTNLKRRTQSVQ